MAASKVILITGCSSGIGRALSEELHRRGHRVVATARSVHSLRDLKARGITVHQLDVTRHDEARQVVTSVVSEMGRIDVLVNNAGYGLVNPLMDVPETELSQQFATNVIGPHLMTRLVAPSMRKSGSGLIVNVGSISGIVTTPFAGAYCASKAALHALSDALRMELAPFGISVMTVQAGGIETNFGNASLQHAHRLLSDSSWYIALKQAIQARARISQENAMRSDAFAVRLATAIESRRPPAYLRLGHRSFTLPLLHQILPVRLFDSSMKRRFGLKNLSRGNDPQETSS